MNTYRCEDYSALREIRRPVHLAIGMFDGLHIGHQTVIHSAIRAAGVDEGISGILTFDPHPSHLFRPDSPTPQIYPAPVKEELLKEMNLDLCIIQTFDADFARNSAEEFVDWLCDLVPSLASVSVGENFRFGKGRKGAPSLLVEKLRTRGISVFSCERVQLDGDPISSTRIRGLLQSEPIEVINHLLGRPYHSIGIVQKGKQLGRTIGFPTLNLPVESDIYPTYGVYLVRYRRTIDPEDKELWGIANFGLRPTVEQSEVPLLEIHSLDPCPADYGDTIIAKWIRFLRPEKKFKGLDELKNAIQEDLLKARDAMQKIAK